MNLEVVRSFLGWCALINYLILIVWFLAFVQARSWLYQMHTKWFRLSAEDFDRTHYLGMAIYKIGILLFFLVPYLVLRFKF